MTRYIFLDIDGVLNHDEWYTSMNLDRDLWEYHPGDKEWYGYYNLDPVAIHLLNKLAPSVIVITSTWRGGQDTIERLKFRGLQLDIVGETNHYHKDWIWRGNEIQEYLCNLPEDHEYEYVIFDDNTDMLPGQNFIHVDSVFGLTELHIKKAKKLLKLE